MSGEAVKVPFAVVVGVSYMPGLGFSIAKRFAMAGQIVGIVGRQLERLEACKAAILEASPSSKVVLGVCDATVPDQVTATFDVFKKEGGPPTCLIFNLSCRPFPPTKIMDVQPEKLESDWKTGPYSALLCTQ